MNIYVTRPGQAGVALTQLLQTHGYAAMHFPLFSIEQKLNDAHFRHQLSRLSANAIIIVLSSAVVSVLQKQFSPDNFAAKWQYLAIGQKTASLFQDYLNKPVQFPIIESSEGIMLHPVLQKVQDRPILILRGTTGRDYLAVHLSKRGARVQCIACYERVPVNYSGNKNLDFSPNSIITATSNECIHYLNQWVSNQQKHSVCLLVSSARIRQEAKDANWPHITLSKSADNQILFKTICSLCHNKTLNMQQDEDIHDREKKSNCP